MKYSTKDGEKLDAICARHYGFTNNSFENVLFDPKNYDLTTSEVFTAGIEFELPIVKPDEKKQTNSLWD